MKLYEYQKKALAKIDFSGKSGKDQEIAKAMRHKRENAIYHDALDKRGSPVEYKKQKSQQWLDTIKFATMTSEQRKIPILFFMHDGKRITSIYQATYDEVIAKMGYTTEELDNLNNLLKSNAFKKRMHQFKAPINEDEIKSFTLLHSFVEEQIPLTEAGMIL